MDIIKEEIESFRKNYPKHKNLADEHVFSLICYQYFFNDGDFHYSDYSECFTDGNNDGGIDLITVNEKNGQDCLVLIQSKMITDLQDNQDIIDIFCKMHQTELDFKNELTANYNKDIKRIYKEQYDRIENQPPNITFVLFISVEPSESRKSKIDAELQNHEFLSQMDITIYYKEEIESQISKYGEAKPYVDFDKVCYVKDDGIIRYQDNGLLLNVKANSLRDLYDKHKDKGLFEQNFRYFVKNKRIDENIILSLAKKRQEFWFLNNGVIIGCKEFWVDGDVVKLQDFSIINGCQTVTLIGEYKGKNEAEDFVVPCKIVKPIHKDDFFSFISEIAESSNSQKPISDRDLKANKPEQRKLQELLKQQEPKIYLRIKRGEPRLPRSIKSSIESWQELDNYDFGQMILAFHFQMPGTSRSGRGKLFSTNAIYDRVYKRDQDKENIKDTLRIFHYYKEFLNTRLEKDQFTDIDHRNVATNGKYIIPAIIGFMIKEKRGLLNTRKIDDGDSAWVQEITKDNIYRGPLFSSTLPDNFTDILDDLFYDITYELFSCYQTRKAEEKTVSNFFKADSKYAATILKHIVSKYYRLTGRETALKKETLKIFE